MVDSQTIIVFLEALEQNRESDSDLRIALDYSRFVKQRSQTWFKLREMARVTGSTLNKAVGLSAIKEQTAHYSRVVEGKEDTKQSFSADVQKAIDHGVQHEVHGIATLVGKVLPVYLPHTDYYESGCYVEYSEGKPFLIVS